MKNVITLTLVMMLFATATFAQAEKNLIKSLAANNITVATLELPGEVETSYWENDFIRITATVNVSNTSEEILKRLVIVGRYDIESVEEGEVLFVRMPKVEHQVIIKGVNLEEAIRYEVQLPNHVKAQVKQPTFYMANQTM